MLEIVDINTHANHLAEVTRLKEEFRTELAGVSEGSVIIINRFPAVGDMIGPLDYLILLNIVYKKGNYLSRKVNGQRMYINHAVIHINAVQDDEVTGADEQQLQKGSGLFDYPSALKAVSGDLRDYLLAYADCKPFGFYRLRSTAAAEYHNPKLMLNYELTSKFLLWGICWQTANERGSSSVNSFPRNDPYTTAPGALTAFAKQLLDELEARTKYGILTKKKIDRISGSVKQAQEIQENVGSSLSVISGKAGTGKTLMLTRVVQLHSKASKVARLLTFNKLLVYDLIQTLRNFPQYNSLRLSVQTVHQFFYHQAQLLGITLIMGEQRVAELLQTCEQRISLLQPIYEAHLAEKGAYQQDGFIKAIAAAGLPAGDRKEFLLFARYLRWHPQPDFGTAQTAYLHQKRVQLQPHVGHQLFLADYPKVIERIYEAVTNTRLFYDNNQIRSRYDLLHNLYRLDKAREDEEPPEITPEEFAGQVSRVKGSVNWARLFLIDECQDFFVLEKEILYAIRGPENLVVATGGKEQLIRQNQLLDWTVSLGRRIPHLPFKLQDFSYRQKQNMVGFVNAFGQHFGLPINLRSVSEQQGVGKVIIDLRPNTGLLRAEVAEELKLAGEINGCSPYESLLVMVPAKGYTEAILEDTLTIDEMDVVQTGQQHVKRKTRGLDSLEALGYFCWDGVSEDKAKLKVPQQTDTRIIHYESCRGLEAWSCALLSFDQFFHNKRQTEQAATHLADDLFLSETERRDKFGALWCLMAITRPIDTLYLHLENPESEFATRLLSFAAQLPGVAVFS